MTQVERLRRAVDRYRDETNGQGATAYALADLDARDWTVLHHVTWPGRELASIDHVVVGPSGVFVIDSNNWAGPVTTVAGVLRRKGRPQTETTRAAREAALAVAAQLPSLGPDHVVPVLCFTDGDVPDGFVDGVLICSIVTVVHQLTTRPAVLSDAEVQAVASELPGLLPPAPEPEPAPRRGPTRRGVVGTAGALALAVVFFAVSSGIADDDRTPPPADPTIQPQGKHDKKQDTDRVKNGTTKQDGQPQR